MRRSIQEARALLDRHGESPVVAKTQPSRLRGIGEGREDAGAQAYVTTIEIDSGDSNLHPLSRVVVRLDEPASLSGAAIALICIVYQQLAR